MDADRKAEAEDAWVDKAAGPVASACARSAAIANRINRDNRASTGNARSAAQVW
jgi:hypothetical protein